MADLEIQGSIKRTKKGNVNWYYGGGEEAWVTKGAAYTGIPMEVRRGQVFAVDESGTLVQYWWNSSNLANGAEVLFIPPPVIVGGDGGGDSTTIADSVINPASTWSSSKINSELSKKISYDTITYVNPNEQGKLNI